MQKFLRYIKKMLFPTGKHFKNNNKKEHSTYNEVDEYFYKNFIY